MGKSAFKALSGVDGVAIYVSGTTYEEGSIREKDLIFYKANTQTSSSFVLGEWDNVGTLPFIGVNGLTTTGLDVKLGGTLTGNTNIDTNSFGVGFGDGVNITGATYQNTLVSSKLAILDSPASGSSIQVLVRNETTGVIEYSTVAGTLTGATNGLGIVNFAVVLGGTLTGDTLIETNGNSIGIGSGVSLLGTNATAFGCNTTVSGTSSFAAGNETLAEGYASHAEGGYTYAGGAYSHSQGKKTRASGDGSHSGGYGITAGKEICALGFAAFTHTQNTGAQTVGHGAMANNSAILGGINHNIASGNLRAAIIGGNAIKLTGTSYIDTTAVAKLAIMSVPTSGASTQILTRNTSTGVLEYTHSSGITGGGGGASSWIDLNDTDPTGYTGQGGKGVRVNAGQDGLEFYTIAGGANSYVSGMTFNTSDGVLTLTRSDGLPDINQDLDDRYSLTGHTHSEYITGETNYYLTGLSFDTGTGVLTADVSGATNPTVDLDDRYYLDSNPSGFTSANDFLTGATFNTGDGVITLEIKNQSNTTVDIDGRYCTTDTNVNYYLTGLSFDTGTGILTGNVSGATNPTIDLDGRYSLTGHTHTKSDITDFSDGDYWKTTGTTNVTTPTISGDTTFDGTLTISTGNTLTVAEDTDAATILGRTRIDSRFSDYAYFSHYDRTETTGYALRQATDGTTVVNSYANDIIFAITNGTKWTIEAAGNLVGSAGNSLTVDGDVILSGTTTSGSTSDDILTRNPLTGVVEYRAASGVTVSFGTDNQIPFMNTGSTNFEYSANLIFDGNSLWSNRITSDVWRDTSGNNFLLVTGTHPARAAAFGHSGMDNFSFGAGTHTYYAKDQTTKALEIDGTDHTFYADNGTSPILTINRDGQNSVFIESDNTVNLLQIGTTSHGLQVSSSGTNSLEVKGPAPNASLNDISIIMSMGAVSGGNLSYTSNHGAHLGFCSNFIPTSGTGTFTVMEITPTINQTGGASGTTRGIHINPTLTAAADFRAIDIVTGSSIFGGDVVLSGTTSGSTSDDILTRNPTTGAIEYRTADSLGSEHTHDELYWKVTGTTNVITPIISGNTIFTNGMNLASESGNVILGDTGSTDFSYGGLYFGDTGDGIYRIDANNIDIKTNTVVPVRINSVGMYSPLSSGFQIRREAATATTPNLIPNRASATTGIGGVTGEISLIITGTSALNIDTERNSLFNGNVTITGDTFITGDTTVGGQILGSTGSAGAPSITFGSSPDLGLYQQGTSAVIGVAINGTEEFVFANNILRSNDANGFAMLNEVSTATNPTLIPNRNSVISGIGGICGEVSLITGSLEAINIDTGQTVSVTAGDLFVDDGILDITSTSSPSIELRGTSASASSLIRFYQGTTTRRSYIQHVNAGQVLKVASEYGSVSLATDNSGGSVTDGLVVDNVQNVIIPNGDLVLSGTTTSGSTSDDILTRNPTTGVVEYRDTSTLASDLDNFYWKTTGTTNVTTPTISGDTTFGGTMDISGNTTLAPTSKLYLDGGGDTYISETSANVIGVTIEGITNYQFNGIYFRVASGTGGAALSKVGAGLVQHTFKGDENSGLGWNSADNISLRTNAIAALTVDSGQTVTIQSGMTLASVPTSGASGQILTRNAATGLVEYTSIGDLGGGVSDFLSLTDTPSSFSGQGGNTVRVNSAEDELEFYDNSGDFWKVTGTTNVTNPVISGSSSFANNLHISGQTILKNGTTGSPSLRFENSSNSGWYSSGTAIIKMVLGGTDRWQYAASNFIGLAANGPELTNVTSTSTVPTFKPNRGNSNAGIGGASGEVSIITGNIEALTVDISQNVTIPASLGINGAAPASTIPLRVTLDDAGTEHVELGQLYTRSVSSNTVEFRGTAADGTFRYRAAAAANNPIFYMYAYQHSSIPASFQLNAGTAGIDDRPGESRVWAGDAYASSVGATNSSGGDLKVYGGDASSGASTTEDGIGGHLYLRGGIGANAGADGGVVLGGTIYVTDSPTSGSTSDVVLVRNESTGVIESRLASDLGSEHTHDELYWKTTGTTNVTAPTISGDTTFTNDVIISGNSIHGGNASFGDGDTYIGEAGANQLLIVTAGGTRGLFANNLFRAYETIDTNATNGPAILVEAATSTNPTLIPNKSDLTTGIGGDVNQLTLISEGNIAYEINTSQAHQVVVGSSQSWNLQFNVGQTKYTYNSQTVAWNQTSYTGTANRKGFSITHNISGQTGSATYDGIYLNVLETTRAATGETNFINFLDNGTSKFRVNTSGDTILNATSKLYLDGGDDTYMHEDSDNSVTLILAGGSGEWNFNTSNFKSGASNGPAMLETNASSTQPSLVPNVTDTDTGIGHDGGNILSLITGAKEAINIGTTQHVSVLSGLTLTQIPTSGASDQILIRNSGTGAVEYTSLGALGGGDVTKDGTAADNQVAVWTGDGAIEGTTGFTWDNTTLTLDGAILAGNSGETYNQIGNTIIDSRFTGFAYFSNVNMSGNLEYALLQADAGDTRINAPTGQELTLNSNNSAKFTSFNNQLIVASGVVLEFATNGIQIGTSSDAADLDGMAIGNSADAGGSCAIALGNFADGVGANSIAMGSVASATGTTSIAIGAGAQANAANTIAIGNDAGDNTTGSKGGASISIGSNSNSIATQDIGDNSIGIGINSYSITAGSVAIGGNASTTGTNAIGIGFSSTTLANGAIAIGDVASATGTSSIAIGDGAEANATGAIAIGLDAGDNTTGTKGLHSITIGEGSNSTPTANIGLESTAVGYLTSAIGNYTTAIGTRAEGQVTGSVSLGYIAGSASGTVGTYALSIGYNSNSGSCDVGGNSVAIGRDTKSTGLNGVAIGNAAEANASGAIAIGNDAGDNTTGTSGTYSISIGFASNSIAAQDIGARSIAIGVNAETVGACSMAIGPDSSASGLGSIAIGSQSFATAQGAILMGYHTSDQTNAVTDSLELAWDGTTVMTVGLGNGMVLENATGGDQGLGTINTKGVYVDGVAVSGGSGGIGGSIAVNQVAIGSGTDTVSGSTGFTWSGGTLTVDSANITNDLLDLQITGSSRFKVSAAGSITAGSDTDTTNVLGRARMDSRQSDRAYFSHFDQSSTTAFALLQLNDGTTYLNSTGGKALNLSIAGAIEWNLNSNGDLIGAAGNNIIMTEIQIGDASTSAAGADAMAIGTAADAGGSCAIAIGNLACAAGANTIVMGNAASAALPNATDAIAFGFGAQANATDAIAIGTDAGDNTDGTDGISSISIGAASNSTASVDIGAKSIAIGCGSYVSSTCGIAMGTIASATGTSAIAIGLLTKATGTNSTAVGTTSDATGTGSVALGNATQSTSTNTLGIGTAANASGVESIAIGSSTTATQSNAVAIGRSADATGTSGVAIGNLALAGASAQAIAIGVSAAASNADAIAIGSNSIASGINSIALGENADATATGAMSLGYNSIASVQGAIMMGYHTSAQTNATGDTLKLAWDGTTVMTVGLGDGMVLENATGGDQGLGTINTKGVYVDGVAVSGGSGASVFSGLTDVTITSPVDGTITHWESSSEKWIDTSGITVTNIGAITAADGVDTCHTFGTAVLEAVATGYMFLSVKGHSTATGFAIAQNPAGDTFVNAETAKQLNFRIGNATQWHVAGATGNLVGGAGNIIEMTEIQIGDSNTTAGGTDAIAIGNTSDASGVGSIAMGANSTASAQGAIMMGYSSGGTQTNATANSLELAWDGNGTTFKVGDATPLEYSYEDAASDVVELLKLQRYTSGTVATGIGGSIGFYSEVTAAAGKIGEIIISSSDITAAEAGRFQVNLMNGAVDTMVNGIDIDGDKGNAIIGHNLSGGGLSSLVMIGSNSTVAGGTSGAIAIGVSADASGPTSSAIAIGPNAKAKGRGSFALGTYAGSTSGTDTNLYFIDIGFKNSSRSSNIGQQSIGLGYLSEATTSSAIAIGTNTRAIGANSAIAIGSSATGGSSNSIAIGVTSKANGVGAIAMGLNSNASAQGAITMGYHTSTQTNSTTDSLMLAWDGTTVMTVGLGDGMVLENATGGDQGLGTINTKGVFVDGVAVSGGSGAQTPWSSNIDAATNYLYDIPSIRDVNQNEVIEFSGVTTAISHVKLTNAASGGQPTFQVISSNTNVGLTFSSKGTGDVTFQVGGSNKMILTDTLQRGQNGGSFGLRHTVASSNTAPTLLPDQGNLTTGVGGNADGNDVSLIVTGDEVIRASGVTSAVNYVNVTNAAAGGTLRLEAAGTDGHIAFVLASKGSDPLSFEVNGTTRMSVTSTGVAGSQLNAAGLITGVAASSTVPTILPSNQYTTTGIGGTPNTDVSIIANSTEVVRFESGGTMSMIEANSIFSPGKNANDLISFTAWDTGGSAYVSSFFDIKSSTNPELRINNTRWFWVANPNQNTAGDFDIMGRNTSTGSFDRIVVTGLTTITGTTGDYVIVADGEDAGNLKKVDVNDFRMPKLRGSATIMDPVATDDATLFYTTVAITIDSVVSHIVGTTNVVFNINHASTRNGTGLDVFSSDITLSSLSGQTNNSGFNDATVPANSWLWLDVVSVSGTPTMFHTTINYAED